MKRSIKHITFIISLFILSQNVQAQTKYKIYAGFINHFTKFVQWPAAAKSGDFVIVVLGNSPLLGEIQPLNGKPAGSQSISVKNVASVGAVQSAHIIFVSAAMAENLADITKKAKEWNALVLAESNGAAKKGADINFVEIEGKVRFEINSGSAESHNLKIANELKKLGIEVN